MSDQVWDYIFCISDKMPTNSNIAECSLQKMRLEFKYWYPLDMRCTGKDLLQNHIAYLMFCHEDIWHELPQFWPVSVRANGLLLLNSAKMSKSTGNFMTVTDAIEKFSADGMRLALADSGDGIEDANFVESVAESMLLRLYNFVQKSISIFTNKSFDQRQGPLSHFADRLFSNRINFCLHKYMESMEKLHFKDAVKFGFYEMQGAHDQYIDMCSNINEHVHLLQSFARFQIILLAPFCPHTCDYLWIKILKNNKSVWEHRNDVLAEFSLIPKEDEVILSEGQHLENCMRNFRKKCNKREFNSAVISVTKTKTSWQVAVERVISSLPNDCSNPMKVLSERLIDQPEMKNRSVKKILPFAAQMLQDTTNIVEFDEFQLFNTNSNYIKTALNNLEFLNIQLIDPSESTGSLRPYNPVIEFSIIPEKRISLLNCEIKSGCTSIQVQIYDNENVQSMMSRISNIVNHSIQYIGIKTNNTENWLKCNEKDVFKKDGDNWILGNFSIDNVLFAYFVLTNDL